MGLTALQVSGAMGLRMIFSDLPSPAEASAGKEKRQLRLRAGGKPVSTFRDHA
jgi:hypothetical protein